MIGVAAFCFLLWAILSIDNKPKVPEYEIDVLLTRLTRLSIAAQRVYDEELLEAVTETYQAVEQLARSLRGR
jgi:hypothetical protein